MFRSIILSLFLISIFVPVVSAQQLSAQQQRLLTEAKNAIDQAQPLVQNLDTATKTLKIGDPDTNVQKTQALLADRDKAVQLLNTANTRFRQLPVSQADVRMQAERVKPLSDTLKASDTKLVEIHNALAKAGSSPTPAPQPQLGTSVAPLGYQQQQLLRDTTSYNDQITGIVEILEEKTKDIKVGDASVQIQDVDNWISNKNRATTYLGYVETRLKQLPATHPNVKTEADRYEKLKGSVAALDTKLTAVRGALITIVEKGGGTQYKADFDRLREINQMFANPRVMEERPALAVEIIKQIPNVKNERQDIVTRYADLLKQSTDGANQMNSVLKYSDELFGKFEKSMNEYAAAAPAAIDKDLADTVKLAEDGVANKRTAYFQDGGGVPQRLGWAETKLKVLTAIKPTAPETTAAKQKVDATRQQMGKMQESLTESIIAANRPPVESYSGADKAQMVNLIKAKWATSGSTAPVLKMGINSQQSWTRETRWEWVSTRTWQKVDKSWLQGFVIIKQSDTMAAVYYINLVKDHMQEDRIEAFFFDDPKEQPPVIHKMLLSNVK